MDAWRMRFDDKWREAGIEALISPCQYHCAFKVADIDLAFQHDYYMLWNFTHFPSGVVPVTTVKEEESRGTYIKDINSRWVDKTAY